ncbi:APC family permease [Paractinoplanes brasiliensis]|uniref:Amino acid transporter n=1 Tax=Paractinoplanes brasiliensis TaxID=52695 RepID=A0A4R6JT94_9ACTN|nr:amino acid transporter [Actinoplanes brasiliensis]GID26987.1 amino acid permease [Actinoplanes brasiliensis]
MSASRSLTAPGSSVSHALAANRLGPFAIGAAIASSVAPLTVVTLVVSTAVAVTGLLGFPIAVITVAAILLLFVVGYLAMARHIPNAGAFYAYVAQGLGRPLGVGTSWFALATYTSFLMCCFGGFGALVQPLVSDWVGLDVPWWILALTVWVLVAVLGANEVSLSEKVLVVLVVAETILVLVYSLAIMLTAGFTFNTGALSLDNLWSPSAGVLVVIGMTAFAGVEQSVVYIEESKNPRRTIRVATYATVLVIAAVYVYASLVQISAGGPSIIEQATSQGGDLFFNQAAGILGHTAVIIGRLFLGTGLIAALIAFHNAATRYGFALGREGVLPRLFGHTTLKGAPRVASLVLSAVTAAVLVVYAVAGWDPLVQLFYLGSTTGGFAVLLLYTLTSIAVIAFFAKDARGEGVWQRLLAPLLSTGILLLLAFLAVDNLHLLFGVNPGTGPARWVPIVLLAILVGGTVWGLILKRLRPDVYAGIGRGTRSSTASGLQTIL